VNWSAALVADVAPGVVTVMSTVPVPAGAVAMISVSDTTVKLVAAVVPKLTPVAPVNPVPVMSTVVPPDASPDDAESAVTTGADGGAGGVV
jgi:hypothetical protein